jgi:hypothetical protein
MTTEAYYFGSAKNDGHYLFDRHLRSMHPSEVPGFPWNWEIDTGLLKNKGIPDQVTGEVHLVCGGNPLWLGFIWWDRTGDRRPGSNSGFYVRGFTLEQHKEAFEFACATFPKIVARQQRPLALVT